MACSNWIPSKVTLNASRIPVEDRIEFMVSNALQPIPEHKFDTLYFYLFNEPFKPILFGRYADITEVIASQINVYRTISNDGTAYVHYNNKSISNNSNTYKHTIPQWSIKPSNKMKIFHKLSIILKLYKNNQYIRNIDLTEILFNDINKCFLTFGRDNNCDLCGQHASISRIHSIFQFSNDGMLFVYDVSLHGIFINNKPIPKQKYVECKNNDKIRFGHSSRIYYLNINKHGKNKNVNNCIQINDKENENLMVTNNQQKNEINRLEKTINKLTMDLNNAQETIGSQSTKVISLMEQLECLKVTDSYNERMELKKLKNKQEFENKNEESESEYEDESDSDNEEKRISKINGIDFVKEINNLSNLTVVKLKYYTDKNNINVGRVKKSQLVKIIKKDIKNYFDI